MANSALLKKYKFQTESYAAYCIMPNKCTLCKGNGLEIHTLETELILSDFRAKLYHY